MEGSAINIYDYIFLRDISDVNTKKMSNLDFHSVSFHFIVKIDSAFILFKQIS